MKKFYPVIAFAGAAASQYFVWDRCMRMGQIKDYTPPDSWTFQNVGLVMIALLLLAPVLRHGVAWQRIVAVLLCAFPLFLVGALFYSAFTELRQR